MNLVPAVARSFREVSEAQAMRGLRVRRLAAVEGVVVPVALTALESSIQLAEAMEARAFGSGRRTRFHLARWGLKDSLVAGGALLAVGLFVTARALGLDPDWYPFPALSAPHVHPVLVTACALLAMPAL
jgi:energy-coupling factor transport system permease protein